MSDFEKYFNTVCRQMKDAYSEIAATFYTYAGPKVPKELVDQAIFYRLGIVDTPPHSNDTTVNGILENLIYSSHLKLPHRLFNRISECVHAAFPNKSQHAIRSSLLHNYKHPQRKLDTLYAFLSASIY
jgi:hypothetical protein